MSASAFTVELLQRQNRDLREEAEELRETIRQLREDQGGKAELPDWLPPLTRKEQAILGRLKRGSLVTKDQLYEASCIIADHEPEMKIIDVYIHKLRKKLRGTGVDIETIWGQGYRLTAASRALLNPTALAA
jgi:DNA-binding response OmpR family regulator